VSDERPPSEDGLPGDGEPGRANGAGGEIEPIRDADDLLGEALRRMSERQRETILGKAADEALRLDVKKQEGDVDQEVIASNVAAAAEAAKRLGQAGADFELRSEHRSQHGSVHVTVRRKRPPLVTHISPVIAPAPRWMVAVVVSVAIVLCLIGMGLWTWRNASNDPAPRAGPASSLSSPDAGRAIRFVDGDTLVVSLSGNDGTEEKIRLLAIDTPERGQPWYAEAGTALSELVGNAPLRLDYEEPGKPERDKYGRVLAYVMVNGQNVNVEIVRRGWSAYVTKYGSDRYSREFIAAEDEARAAHRGIWSSR
jgi:micrococcal nuclease